MKKAGQFSRRRHPFKALGIGIYRMEEVEAWLKEYDIADYFLEDPYEEEDGPYLINVKQDVLLFDRGISAELPVYIQFGTIKGNFDCSMNKLESLRGMPLIVMGHFDCSANRLKSLGHGPKEVHGDYDCHSNELTSLEGMAELIGGNIDCRYNNLG